MPGTLTPTCSFCGLRFASRPLLDLHIREDHLQRDHHPGPDRGDAARAGASQPGAGGPAPTHGQSSRPSRTAKEVITLTAIPWRRLRAGWAMAAARAVIRAIRRINAELLLASEAMVRPAGAPQPGSRAQVPASSPAVFPSGRRTGSTATSPAAGLIEAGHRRTAGRDTADSGR